MISQIVEQWLSIYSYYNQVQECAYASFANQNVRNVRRFLAPQLLATTLNFRHAICSIQVLRDALMFKRDYGFQQNLGAKCAVFQR